MTTPATGWLRSWTSTSGAHPADASPPAPTARLVCLPHAGGAASWFHRFAAAIPAGVELLAVQYPGHEDRLREPCLSDLHELADGVADALIRGPAELPVHLFGHSMGAWVAYEVARRLEASSTVPVASLHVSGAPAPAAARAGQRVAEDDDALWAQVGALGGVPDAVLQDEDLRALLLPVLRADLTACASYRPRTGAPSLRCGVWVSGGSDDPGCRTEDLRSWRHVTGGGVELRTWRGGHFYLADDVRVVLAPLLADTGAGPRSGDAHVPSERPPAELRRGRCAAEFLSGHRPHVHLVRSVGDPQHAPSGVPAGEREADVSGSAWMA